MAARIGAYRRYELADLARVRRLVFVCKGNICRSPFAEAVARSVGIVATSYGLDARRGLPADPNAARAAIRQGVSVDSHLTRPLGDAQIDTGDLIVAMEPGHVSGIHHAAGERACDLVLLGMWLDPALPYLFDPYAMSDLQFDTCFGRIRDATLALISACP